MIYDSLITHTHTHTQRHTHIHTCRYVEYVGLKVLYDSYRNEATKTKYKVLSRSYFHNLWLRTMRKGVTDPSTAVQFTTFVRTSRARGFAKCNRCEYLKAKMTQSVNKTHRDAYGEMLAKHYASVNLDREELARYARSLLVPPSVVACALSVLLTFSRVFFVSVVADSVRWTTLTSDSTSTRSIVRNLASRQRLPKQNV